VQPVHRCNRPIMTTYSVNLRSYPATIDFKMFKFNTLSLGFWRASCDQSFSVKVQIVFPETYNYGRKSSCSKQIRKGGLRPILLKNSVFGEIGEIFARTAQLAFSGEGFGQIGFLSLMCQLTAPHGRSHLTFRYCGFFPKNYDI